MNYLSVFEIALTSIWLTQVNTHAHICKHVKSILTIHMLHTWAFSSTYLNSQRNIWDVPVICRHVLRENFWIFKEEQDVPSRTQIRIHFVLLFWILTLEHYPVDCLLMLPFFPILNHLLVILPCKTVHREVWKSCAHSAISLPMTFWGNMSWIRNKAIGLVICGQDSQFYVTCPEQLIRTEVVFLRFYSEEVGA